MISQMRSLVNDVIVKSVLSNKAGEDNGHVNRKRNHGTMHPRNEGSAERKKANEKQHNEIANDQTRIIVFEQAENLQVLIPKASDKKEAQCIGKNHRGETPQHAGKHLHRV